MIIAYLVMTGLFLGSFINALVWRLHQQSVSTKKSKYSSGTLSITKGRSICTSCGHRLSPADLIPVLSWIRLRGKCRYCKAKIHWQYPLVELSMAVLLLFSYLFWPQDVVNLEVAVFGIWALILTGLVSLFIYDLKWMILPNRIILPLYFLAAVYVLLNALGDSSTGVIVDAALGVLVGGGFFYILFQVSQGRWIGGGDVKLGFLLGAMSGSPVLAGLMLFSASFLGSIYSLPLLMSGKITKHTRIPFGPFLIIGGIFAVLFGEDVLNVYLDLIGF